MDEKGREEEGRNIHDQLEDKDAVVVGDSHDEVRVADRQVNNSSNAQEILLLYVYVSLLVVGLARGGGFPERYTSYSGLNVEE